MRFRSAPLLAVLATAALAAAGCGGSSDSGSSGGGGGYGSAPASSKRPDTTAAASTPSSAGAVTIKTGPTSELGTFLVDADGRTLYLWKADTGSKSTCEGPCAQAWPPLTTDGAPKATGDAKASALGTTKRSDGSTQVTYNGHPLYLFQGDRNPGDTNGQNSDGFGAEWYVVDPAGNAIDET
jgi:predicted lipoprotein with Yx(FWY)xxD motif